MALHFSRDTKVYVEIDGAAASPNPVWQIPVLDGFSLSQATNSSEITLNEAGTTSRRARLLFNDSLAPVEWSFSTYARPFVSNGTLGYTTSNTTHAVEEVLWAMASGASDFDGDTAWTGAASPGPINYSGSGPNYAATINFDSSNLSYYPEGYNIYFSFSDGAAGQNVYRITKAVVNSVTMDFDIDGIATFTWSGFGSLLQDDVGAAPTATHTAGITDTGAFIRTRLSDVTLVRTDVSPDETYNLIITGGSISYENNMAYLTPEELGLVNQPLGNVTGARAISGTLTCYLDTTISPNYSAQLLADLVSDTTTVRNVFDMSIDVGGTGTYPSVQFDIPTAHLEIPNPTVEDVIAVEINFHGQVGSGDVSATNEMTVIYNAST